MRLQVSEAEREVVIVGGGAVPGWALVGNGVFSAASTARTMASLIARGVHWLKSGVAAFEPERNAVVLDGCRIVKYRQLVVCPGLKLD